MSRPVRTVTRILAMLSAVSISAALAQDYTIDWHTVDGGGETWSTGGDYALGGTLGQCDAGTLTGSGPGGTYTLTGGFWALPPCWCLSDLNNDGQRDGDDIQAFADCLLGGAFDCACADLDTDGSLTFTDVTAIVTGLLSTTACP